MVDATKKAYTGTVTTELAYLNPADKGFAEQMPGGDLAAIRADGSDAQLVSYGMICVNIYSASGEKLQLKEGAQAKVIFPIPAGMEAHSVIPLWSFNEETGLWEEEGEATLEGDHYVGYVKHFSWANLDYPELRGTVNVKVVDTAGAPIPNVPVVIGQITRYTSTSGKVMSYVPINESFNIYVDLSTLGGNEVNGEISVSPLSKGEVREYTVKAPNMRHVKGTIVNSAGGSALSTLCINYTEKGQKKSTRALANDFGGTFDILAPVNYKGAATLHIYALEGATLDLDINLNTNSDINLGVIDIKAKSVEGGLNVIYDGKVDVLPVKITNDGGMTHALNTYSFASESYDEFTPSFGFSVDDYGEASENMWLWYHMATPDGNFMMINCSTNMENYETGEKLENPSIKIERKGDYYDVTISGKAMLRNEGPNIDHSAKIITIAPSTLKIPVCTEIEVKRNVDASKCGLPSFTPMPSTTAKMVERITVFGKDMGGGIYTNGDYAEYKKLKAQADKLGFTLESEYDEEGYRSECSYKSGDNTLQIIYAPYGIELTDETNYAQCHNPKITIKAYINGYSDGRR